MNKPTTGPYSHKKYKCRRCGHERMIGTNHWGAVYSRCSECSWKHPMETDVSDCLDPRPEGIGIPEEWKVVKLGEICSIK